MPKNKSLRDIGRALAEKHDMEKVSEAFFSADTPTETVHKHLWEQEGLIWFNDLGNSATITRVFIDPPHEGEGWYLGIGSVECPCGQSVWLANGLRAADAPPEPLVEHRPNPHERLAEYEKAARAAEPGQTYLGVERRADAKEILSNFADRVAPLLDAIANAVNGSYEAIDYLKHVVEGGDEGREKLRYINWALEVVASRPEEPVHVTITTGSQPVMDFDFIAQAPVSASEVADRIGAES